MPKLSKLNPLLPAIALLAALAATAHAQTAEEVIQATRVEAGLVVHAPATDGALESGLVGTGRFVVQGLAADEAAVERARQALKDAGTYGLASISDAGTLPRLPYADHLVNLLILDADALGDRAPSEDEVRRVIAPQPRGAAYVKRGGQWSVVRKPMPETFDEWTHYEHGPDGNPVSRDTAVGPINLVQWVAGRDFTDVQQEYRLGGGRAVYDYEDGREDRPHNHVTGGGHRWLTARDAFSGILLWRREIKPRDITYNVTAVGDRVYTTLDKNGPLVALDAATGETLVTFDQGGRQQRRETMRILIAQGKVIQAADDTLYVLDADSGELLWKHQPRGSKIVAFPAVGDGKVFVAVGQELGMSRVFKLADGKGILAFDLASGEQLWSNTDPSDMRLSQLVYADGKVVTFESGTIFVKPRESPVLAIDAATGKTAWRAKSEGIRQALMVRDGRVVVSSPVVIDQYDLASGELLSSQRAPSFGSCIMPRATTQYLMPGYSSWLRDDGQVLVQYLGRGGCSEGNTPGYGMLYTLPNDCGCFNSIRGSVALTPRAMGEPVADEARLTRGAAYPQRADSSTGAVAAETGAGDGPARSGWPTFRGGLDRTAGTDETLGDSLAEAWATDLVDWQRDLTSLSGDAVESEDPALYRALTAPTIGYGHAFVAAPFQHTLYALDQKTGEQAWAFTAGGRIDGPPTLTRGLAIFGCRDGYVYALDPASGDLVWKFLAAPYDARITDHSQVESHWPVPAAVAAVGDSVIFAAGRHEETGGLMLWRLDARTGAIRAKRFIRIDQGFRHVDDDAEGWLLRRGINRAFVSDGELLHMPGLTIDPDTLEHVEDSRERLYVTRYHGTGTGDTFAESGSSFGGWAYSNWGDRPSEVGKSLFGAGRGAYGPQLALTDDALYTIDANSFGLKDTVRYDLKPDGKRAADKPAWSADIGYPYNQQWRDKGIWPRAFLATSDRLYIAGGPYGGGPEAKGQIIILNANTGERIATVQLDAAPVEDGLALADGSLYVACADGSIRRLDPR